MCGDDYCPHHDLMLAETCGEGQAKTCWDEFCKAEMAKRPVRFPNVTSREQEDEDA
jgi:hypothetical protein